MDNWIYLGFPVALTAWLWLRGRRRTMAIKRLATRLGFVYIGEALPRSIILQGPIIECAHSFRNVIDGERAGIIAFAFDFTTGAGKGARHYTALAAQTDSDVFGIHRYGGDLAVHISDGWTFAVGPDGD